MTVIVEAPLVVVVAIQRLLSDTGPTGVHGLTSGRIFRDVAPAKVSNVPVVPPYITVSWISSDPMADAIGDHVWSNVLVLVKITDLSDNQTRLLQIQNRVTTRLQGYERVTFEGVYIHKFRLEQTPPQSDEYIDGRRYTFANLVFRTEAQPED